MRVVGARTRGLWLFACLLLSPTVTFAQADKPKGDSGAAGSSQKADANDPQSSKPPSKDDSPSNSRKSRSKNGDLRSTPSNNSPSSAQLLQLSKDNSGELSAEQLAQVGRTHYQNGDYVAALEAFRRAFEHNPTPALAYNIARSHERLSQISEAIDWYTKYSQLETNRRDRADALGKIELLRRQIGTSSDTSPYEARMMSGRRAYTRGDFEGAITNFKAAFDEAPQAAPLYNIAKSFEKMARYEDAIDYYQQYLELAPNAPDRSDVQSIIERLRRDLKARFQELSVASNPPGADVYLDDRNEGIIGQTNLRAKIKPGPHTLFIDLNGYEPVRREFSMPDDSPLRLEFDLVELENVGYVTIGVEQSGARIFIDGAIVGLSPFTQRKALPAGEHQIQVERVGFERLTKSFAVTRDQTTPIRVDLKKYKAPISDGTLSDWGRNLLIFGVVGGGLGFAGPKLYQEFVHNRPYYSDLGPESRSGPYYDGSSSLRSNDELNTLETIQTISIVTGSTLIAGGLGFYMFKWFRKKPPPPVTASRILSKPLVEITGFGINPLTKGGSTVGITGRF